MAKHCKYGFRKGSNRCRKTPRRGFHGFGRSRRRRRRR